jgi:hypothetical protein
MELHFFIQSDLFRDWLSRKIGRSIHAEGRLEPLTWEGSNFQSAGFTATGTGKAKLRSVKASKISAHVDWHQLLKGQFVIDYLNIEKVDAIFGKGASPVSPVSPSSPKPTSQASSWTFSNLFRPEIRINHVYVADANLHWTTNHGESGQFTGSKISATQIQPDQWNVDALGGTVQHAAYPPIGLTRASGTISHDSIVVHQANATLAGGAAIELTGDIAIAKHLNANLTARFTDIDANTASPQAWRFGGRISGQLTYKGDLNHFEHGEVAGSIKISQAAINLANVFATLHQLAKFGGLNEVQLDSVATDIRYQDGDTQFLNFHASYQDQVRIEGSGSLGPTHIDADLRLGLSPKILGWIPGAEEHVFAEQKDGLRWTAVRISGTPEQPREDLTKRLVGAFRDKMTKEFKGQAKDAIKSLLDMFHN